jgi:hypothetical protein
MAKHIDGYRFNQTPDGIWTPGATSIIKYAERIEDPTKEADLLAHRAALEARASLAHREAINSLENWDNALCFGTAMHDELDAAAKLGIEPAMESAVALWSRVKKDFPDQNYSSEVPVLAPDLWLMGTADLEVCQPGEILLCDYKTTSKYKPKCYAQGYLRQLALYSAAYEGIVSGRIYYWVKSEKKVSVTNFDADELINSLTEMRYYCELFKREYFDIAQQDDPPEYWHCKPSGPIGQVHPW